MPDFFTYLNKSLLPQMPYWSNILLEKPSSIQANTEKKHNLLVINNVNINNKTNAIIKNVFKHKKADNSTLNEPIVHYFKRKYKVNVGLKKNFLGKLLKIDNALQDSSMSNRDVATLSSIRETSKSSPLPKMYRKPNVLKEKFKKQNKRSSANSSFLVQPKNKIDFHSVKTTPTLQNKPYVNVTSMLRLRYVNVPEKALLCSLYSKSNSLKKWF